MPPEKFLTISPVYETSRDTGGSSARDSSCPFILPAIIRKNQNTLKYRELILQMFYNINTTKVFCPRRPENP
jgi:hypothetical protein